MKRRFIYGLLAVCLTLLLALFMLVTTNWGLSITLSAVSAVVPGQLEIEGETGSLLGPLSVERLHYRHEGIELVLGQLDLDWRSSALLSGEVRVNNLEVDSVKITLYDVKTEKNAEVASLKAELVLPFNVVIAQSNIRNVSIRAAGSEAPAIIDQLSLAASTDKQNLSIQTLLVQAYEMQLRLSGKVALQQALPLELKTDYVYQLGKTEQLKSQGMLQGDLKKLHITQRLSGLIDATLEGHIDDIQEKFHWQATLKLTQFTTADMVTQFPDLAVVGDIYAQGHLNKVSVQGKLELDEKNIGVAVLDIDAQSDLPAMDYRYSLQGNFTGVDLPEASLNIQGQGDLQQITLSTLAIKALNGGIAGAADIRWAPDFLMNADLNAHGIDPGVLATQWSGKLNGNLTLKSELEKGHPRIEFSVNQLNGELRNYPVQAHARGNWYKETFDIAMLDVSIDQSQLNIKGMLAHKWDVQFDAVSPNLNQLLPGAHGKFDLRGEISGNRDEPRIVVKGKAAELAYEQESVNTLSLQIDVGLAETASLLVDVEAKDVMTRAGHWRSAFLKTTGNNKDHTLLFNLDNEKHNYALRMLGKFVPWHWQGQVSQLDVEQNDIGKWHLKAPVDISLKGNEIRIKPLCLLQGAAYICSEADWGQKQQMAGLDGKSIPMTLLKPWLPENIHMTGQLDIQASLHSNQQHGYDAMLKIHSAEKAIAVNFVDLNETLTLAASEILATLDSKSLQAKVHLPLSEGGGIDGDIHLTGWSIEQPIARNQPVRAHLLIDRIPADTITRFVPDIARAHGYLNADFKVNGTLGEPQLRGKANWLEGNMILPELGISIRDIHADVESTQTNFLKFRIQARSGEGDAELNGQTHLDPGQGWPTQLRLSSQNLEVINIPEAYVLIDSNVDVAIQGSTINVNGEITVPRARLRPRTLPEGTVGLSRDVVIMSAEEEAAKQRRWFVTSEVRVKLGELVDFDGFGVSGKLRGNLLLIDEPGKLPVGQGEVNIAEGIYRLRGQDLQIRRGRLIFADTFLDDPGVDVDAVREIDTVTVGVRLKGTLKKPQLTIFSEPAMAESDALSYLILGHAASQSTPTEAQSKQNTAVAMGFIAGDLLSQEIGGRLGLDEMRVDVGDTAEKTSLVMGKYLSPKLYLRYFSGIVESSSIVQLRYQLSKRVQIQTEGGYRGSQSITGGDILFTIEY